MSRGKKQRAPKSGKKPIEQYEHADKKRANIPPVGLVTPDTDPPEPGKQQYQYDPHLDRDTWELGIHSSYLSGVEPV